ncbi:MAG: 3-methyladenine DNA glycosylase Tag [Flavobacteriales bacterium]|jgi:3-methyladenine DNA glycosylase Tag
MRHFDEIYGLASLHKGGSIELEAYLPQALSSAELKAQPDSEYLSLMSRRVFRAGLKHAMVDAKWPAFEQQFSGFDPFVCAMQSDEFIESCMVNKAIIRHLGKIRSIRKNAQFILDCQQEYGSFGTMLSEWPQNDVVGLWLKMKKQGAHLGGGSGPSFMRMAGADTFLLTNDVLAVLRYEGVISDKAQSQRDMRAAQEAFLTWQAQSGRPLCEVSRIVSCAAS